MNQAVLKQHPTSKDYVYLYLKEVPVVYASIQEPKKKFEGTDNEYSVTAFVNDETRTYLEDTALINKQLYKVGVDKNKKRQVKYQTSQQREDKKNIYDPYEGLSGINLTRPEFNKKGALNKVVVVDSNGDTFTDLVGNGSVCNIKCFGYRNKEGLLNIQMELVQIIKHVPYTSGGNKEVFDDELGITVGKKEAVESKPKTTNFDGFDQDADQDRPF